MSHPDLLVEAEAHRTAASSTADATAADNATASSRRVAPKSRSRKITPLQWTLVALGAIVVVIFAVFGSNEHQLTTNEAMEYMCRSHFPNDTVGYEQCKQQLSSPSMRPYLDAAVEQTNAGK